MYITMRKSRIGRVPTLKPESPITVQVSESVELFCLKAILKAKVKAIVHKAHAERQKAVNQMRLDVDTVNMNAKTWESKGIFLLGISA